jgi:hypothetical protein
MFYTIVGWAGAALILLAYCLVTTKKLSSVSKEFQWLNLFGAVGVVINSSVHRAFPAVGLNAAWAIVAVYGLVKAFRGGARIRLTDVYYSQPVYGRIYILTKEVL